MTQTSAHLHHVAPPIFTVDIYIQTHDSVLLFKRSEKKKNFPGVWAIPGGHIDAAEDPLAAVIREAREETGIALITDQVRLRYVALHHHIDRNELYIVFGFSAVIDRARDVVSNEEGEAQWVPIQKAQSMENVFPPIKYYFPHVFSQSSGILYNNSQWKDARLVNVLSETMSSR